MTRVGIIGLGEAGTTIHLPALRGVEGVQVVGAADPDKNRRAAASQSGVPVFGDASELFSQARPEFVIVASPPALHARHCVASMEAGAHVLCEKPFAASVREARELIARASGLGRTISVNHEFRAMPIFRDLISQVRNDGSGPVVAQLWQLINHNPASETGWRGALRRRALYEAGVHLVDVALQLFGETPSVVRATFSSGGESGAADSIVLATLEFSGGRLCQLTQCRMHRGDRQYLEVRADTANASYRASFGGRARLTAGLLRSTRPHVAVERAGSGIAWREQGAARAVFARNGGSPLVASTRSVIQACLAAIAQGKPSPFPATDGLESLRVIAAAYLSADIGRAVALDGPERDSLEALPLAEALRA